MAKKKGKKFDLKRILRGHGSSQKDFAKWLGITPEGLSIANKNGLPKAYLESLKNYCLELRGISLEVNLDLFSK